MRPVLIFRHAPVEGPGYFATFLDRHAIPWQLVRIDAGDPLPPNLNGASGLCLMGGPMSVNDALPWIDDVLQLIREAVAHDVPVVGHCLGGQLMAKALGAEISANRVKEIGWGEVRVTDRDAALPWLGNEEASLLVFHWHGETFAIPPGATRILESDWCANQAFVLGALHIGMQCHVEMTPDLVRSWCTTGTAELAQTTSPAVQSAAAMQAGLDARVDRLHRVADKIYSRWIQGLRK